MALVFPSVRIASDPSLNCPIRRLNASWTKLSFSTVRFKVNSKVGCISFREWSGKRIHKWAANYEFSTLYLSFTECANYLFHNSHKTLPDMKNLLFAACLILLLAPCGQAQIDARMFQHPDVSSTQITFVYAGDIWVAPKEGGAAMRLSSPAGEESFPRFSPDGARIAFSGNYDGNTDVYVVSARGGAPRRLTYHGMADRLVDWHPSGRRVLFASMRESGRQRFSQFFTVSLEGGLAERLPVPYGEMASYSPDGKRLAYTDKTRLFRTWKRYRGGMAPHIAIFDLEDYSVINITDQAGNDELPMWHGDRIYYLSDRGPEKRYNIWVYELGARAHRQITRFEDFDARFPSIGPEDIVFEKGGELYLLDMASEQTRKVNIQALTDQATLLPRTEKVGDLLAFAMPSPDGKRVVAQARGELFSLPAEHGPVINLTRSPDAAERYPTWSPNGRFIAYWSDASGEYELMLRDLEKSGADRRLTQLGAGFRYPAHWSPDNKKLAFIDEKLGIHIFDLDNNAAVRIDRHERFLSHGGCEYFHFDWSPDSRWLAYSKVLPNGRAAVFLYDVRAKTAKQATSGYYHDSQAIFDPDGKYLYYMTNRHFQPQYGDFDNSWTYPNATQIVAAPLKASVSSPLAPRNDEAAIKKDEEQKKNENSESKESAVAVEIDLDGLERRAVLLPPAPGNFGRLAAVKGKVIFHRRPNTGAPSDSPSPVQYYDLEAREEKTIVADAGDIRLAANGGHLLVRKNGQLFIVKTETDQKLEKALPSADMEMTVDPKAEWRQIFNDAWRFQRDFFYDPGMHGVDWNAMRAQYGGMVEHVVTRWDLNFILGELIGELNASHTYRGGGDTERPKNRDVGYLGVDWALDHHGYKIQRIVRGAEWDLEARSPVDQPGLDVKAGDYVLSVNGRPLHPSQEPYAAFEGLAGKTVALEINRYPDRSDSARTVIVALLDDETRLRHLEGALVMYTCKAPASMGKMNWYASL
jgi:tricorn protease